MRSPVLAGGLWCLSAPLAAWLWFPTLASVAGSVLGCVLATMLSLAPNRRRLCWAGACWLLLLAGTAWLRNFGATPFSAEANVLLRAGLVSGLTTFAVVYALQRRSGPALVVIECALFATPWVALLKGHRGGHLEQPVGLVEPAWALGVGPFQLFAAMGNGLGVLLILLLATRRSASWKWRTVLEVLPVGLVLALLVPAAPVARLAGEVYQGAAAAGSADTRTTPDVPVAVVVLYQNYEPELGVYHFAKGRSPVNRKEPEATEIRYRVAELVALDEPLLLGWSPTVLPATVKDEDAFAKVYEVRSRTLTTPLSDLLDSETTTLGGNGAEWPPLAAEIVPEAERTYPLRVALRIKLWMEQNRNLGEGEDEQKAYTESAQRLMESVGLTTRLVHGFAVRADQRGEGSFLLLNERNQRWWIELFLEGAGWVVIDLYPLQGPTDAAGPEDQDLQRQLGELARSRGEAFHPLPGIGAGALGLLMFLIVFASGGYTVKLYRHLRRLWCPPERLPAWGYMRLLDRLAEVGEVRQPGETRQEFAQRLKGHLPSLEPLTLLHQKAHLGRPPSDRPGQAPPARQTKDFRVAKRPGSTGDPVAHDNLRPLLTAAFAELARSYPPYRRWLGWLHPFSWMKVH